MCYAGPITELFILPACFLLCVHSPINSHNFCWAANVKEKCKSRTTSPACPGGVTALAPALAAANSVSRRLGGLRVFHREQLCAAFVISVNYLILAQDDRKGCASLRLAHMLSQSYPPSKTAHQALLLFAGFFLGLLAATSFGRRVTLVSSHLFAANFRGWFLGRDLRALASPMRQVQGGRGGSCWRDGWGSLAAAQPLGPGTARPSPATQSASQCHLPK